MDVITKDVRALAKKELAAANRRFRMFASPHEGYAVIREELDELNPRSGGSYSAGSNGQKVRAQPAAQLAGRLGAGLWNGA